MTQIVALHGDEHVADSILTFFEFTEVSVDLALRLPQIAQVLKNQALGFTAHQEPPYRKIVKNPRRIMTGIGALNGPRTKMSGRSSDYEDEWKRDEEGWSGGSPLAFWETEGVV